MYRNSIKVRHARGDCSHSQMRQRKVPLSNDSHKESLFKITLRQEELIILLTVADLHLLPSLQNVAID
jgi:hypothetical protein